MDAVRHFKRGELSFVPLIVAPIPGGPPPRAEIAQLVGPDESRTMGAGIGKFETPIEWEIQYDEMMVVLEGRFRVLLADRRIEAGPGDVIWVPRGTRFTTEGENAVVCYALWPVDYYKQKD